MKVFVPVTSKHVTGGTLFDLAE